MFDPWQQFSRRHPVSSSSQDKGKGREFRKDSGASMDQNHPRAVPNNEDEKGGNTYPDSFKAQENDTGNVSMLENDVLV